MAHEKSCVGCVHNDGVAVVAIGNEPCWSCLHSKADLPCWAGEQTKKQPITNAMKLRSMTDEELAEFLRVIRYDWSCPMRAKNGLRRCTEYKDDCNKCWLDWLKQEALP